MLYVGKRVMELKYIIDDEGSKDIMGYVKYIYIRWLLGRGVRARELIRMVWESSFLSDHSVWEGSDSGISSLRWEANPSHKVEIKKRRATNEIIDP